MKKALSFLLAAVLLCTLIVAVACQSEQYDELVVYNWADYIYDYEEEFCDYYESITGRKIKVTYVTFDTNETMLTKILKGDSVVDVMCPSEYAIQKLLEMDLLLEMNYFDEAKYVQNMDINEEYDHNSDNVDKNFVSKVSEVFSQVTIKEGENVGKTVSMADYFVPYMYGTLGILYNKEYFTQLGIYDKDIMNDANWGILFNKKSDGTQLSDGLTGRIYMKDSIRDSYAATVFYLMESGQLSGLKNSDGILYEELSIGELINTVDDQLVALCQDALIEQKKQLYGYEVDFGKNELIQAIAYVDLAWSGDALYAVEESWDDDYIDPMLDYDDGESGGYKLGYYVPHTSGNIWFDGWVIPKTCSAEHLNAAKIFINFLNRPEVAAQNIIEIGYTAAVSADAIRNNESCRAILSECYGVFDETGTLKDSDGNPLKIRDEDGNVLSQEQCSYKNWEEFADYFFDYVDPIDDSNWRYPFQIAAETDYNRDIETLGVMRDFGENNYKVSTMWESVRSTGITAWALLGWSALAIAVAVGLIALIVFIKNRKMMRVVIKKADK